MVQDIYIIDDNIELINTLKKHLKMKMNIVLKV